MLLNNYTPAHAGKLEKLAVPDLTEPFLIKILWIQLLSYEKGRKKIGRKRHEHSFFEVHFVLSGNIEYSTDKDTYTVCEGMGFISAPEIPHTITDISENLIKLSLTFQPENDSFLYRELSRLRAFSFEITPRMLSCFEDIIDETDKKSVFSMPIIKSRIFDLICSLSRVANIREEQADIAVNTENMRISKIKQYIRDNKGTFFTCTEIANHFHFNPKYLNRIFKEETGSTLLEYIHREKIRNAEELLRSENVPLERISKQLGFANEYYFNSFFRRCTGMTPGLYRKLSENNQEII
ncbi:MAG: helix-turn-helix transcriptional regulator [Clostridia bacterium]|nr:helix-turn-helix transcriptional regulator [Clostridia bacterium]